MAKIIVSEFISLDGIIEGPGPEDPFLHAGWTMPYVNEESMKFKLSELLASDALLLGRTTYEGFASAWPERTDEMGFAEKINRMPKYVVSTTLQTTNWQNSHLISKPLVATIQKLKQEVDTIILVNGSSTLVQLLIANDLVDEYRLMVYPVILGTGKRLFNDVSMTSLQLISSTTFSDIVLLTYKPAPKA